MFELRSFANFIWITCFELKIDFNDLPNYHHHKIFKQSCVKIFSVSILMMHSLTQCRSHFVGHFRHRLPVKPCLRMQSLNWNVLYSLSNIIVYFFFVVVVVYVVRFYSHFIVWQWSVDFELMLHEILIDLNSCGHFF